MKVLKKLTIGSHVPVVEAEIRHGITFFGGKRKMNTLRFFRRIPAAAPSKSMPGCQVIYDGSCPVCKIAIKNVDPSVFEPVNARDGSNPLVKSLEEKGWHFDEGMAVVKGDSVFYGADALNAIGEIDGRTSVKMATSLGSLFYGSLKAVRNLLVGENTIDRQRQIERKAAENQTNAQKYNYHS